jgi:methionine biosynthesis protein MetW
MVLKDFIYKLRQDFSNLRKYPINKLNRSTADYDYYWSQKRQGEESVLSSWQKQRADKVLEMIESGSTVIDFGCGDGAVLKYMKDKKDINGIGVDVSTEALKKAKNLGLEVIKANISNLDSLSDLPEVDYIFGFEIIEHMPSPEEFIAKIKNKAKRALIFSVPNSGYFVHRLRLLFGRFPLQWLTHPGEHLRFWTVKDMKWWIGAMNLKLDKIVIYEGLPIFNKLMPKLFGQGIIVKIKK